MAEFYLSRPTKSDTENPLGTEASEAREKSAGAGETLPVCLKEVR